MNKYILGKKYVPLKLLLLSISILFFLISFIIRDSSLIVTAIFFQFIFNLVYSMENINQKILFFCFNITYFIFLSSRPIVNRFGTYVDYYNQNGLYGFNFTDPEIVRSILIVLYLGSICIFIGYAFFYKDIEIKKLHNSYKSKNNELNISMQIISKYLFYCTYIFSVLIIFDKANHIIDFGYSELYSTYESSYPYIFTKISEMNNILLFIFLGTLPTKKKARIPLIMYFMLNCLSLYTGQRNNFMLSLLVIIIYLFYRNITDYPENWFKKRDYTIGIIVSPFLILFLNFISKIRESNSSSIHTSISYKISEFFYSQSVSSNLIGYSQSLSLPEHKIYSLGRFIDFFKENSITQLFFDFPVYKNQTIESALYRNNFSDSVSYILSPKRYVNGWGYGSSFLAEFFKDGGFILVITGCIVVGIILNYITLSFFKGGVISAFSLSMTRLILYMPRDTFLSFFITTFNIVNILTIIIVLIGSQILSISITNNKSPHKKSI